MSQWKTNNVLVPGSVCTENVALVNNHCRFLLFDFPKNKTLRKVKLY